jgi:ribosomal protein S6--L-glutamate ligase
MGLNVCGVDMLRSNHGPVIMEVNSSPGLKGIEEASGKDIAGLIIEFIENRFKTMESAKEKSSGQTLVRTRTRGKG